MPTLDEYRRKLIMRLEGCAEPAQAKMLMAEADLCLTVSRISEEGRAAFWQSVNRELALFADEVALLRARQLASVLGEILTDLASPSDPRPPQRGIAPESDGKRAPA